MPLRKLHVENFQSIAERTTFDLTKLVLLFGPNSAGKSALEDALQFGLAEIGLHQDYEDAFADSSDFRSLGSGRDSMLSRFWRRSGNRYEDFCFVGLEGSFESTRDIALDGVIPPFAWSWEVTWNADYTDLQDELGRPEVGTPSRIWSFYVNENVLVSSSGINIRHPLLSPLSEALESHLRHFNPTSDPDLSPLICDGILGWGATALPNTNYFSIRNTLFRRLLNTETDYGESLNNLFSAIAKEVDSRIEVSRSDCGQPLVIGDSRTIPTPQDLTFTFHDPMQPNSCLLGNTIFMDLGRDNDFVSRGYWPNLKKRKFDTHVLYRELASGYFTGLSDVVNEEPEDMFENSRWLDEVNHLLADYLFLDNGYQIDAEHAYVLSGKELDKIAKNGKRYRESYLSSQIVMTLMLRDGREQKLHFNEVGSGIGYVLPILISLVSEIDTFNKQPELHLHPALQSQLGDLYLHTAKKNRYIIVETHSEHLLLRVLRRIRQRTRGLLDENDYRFATPSDVSVYYFEPQGNGETKVRPIRISPEGDFLDPWPGGFFEERYEDLFDE